MIMRMILLLVAATALGTTAVLTFQIQAVPGFVTPAAVAPTVSPPATPTAAPTQSSGNSPAAASDSSSGKPGRDQKSCEVAIGDRRVRLRSEDGRTAILRGIDGNLRLRCIDAPTSRP
jgi:hypothetical protein